MKKIIFLISAILFVTSMALAQERVDVPVLNVGSKWTVKADNGWEWTTELIAEEKDTYVFSWVVPEGRWKGEYKVFYSKKNMNCVKVIRDGKEDKELRDIFKKSYDFPIFPKKKWHYRYTVFSERTRRDVDIFAELSVVGVEEVEVPAGKFKAFKMNPLPGLKPGVSGLWHTCHDLQPCQTCRKRPPLRSERMPFIPRFKSLGFSGIVIKAKTSTMGTGRDVSGESYYWYSPDAKVRVKQEWEPGEFWRDLEYTKSELISFELK